MSDYTNQIVRLFEEIEGSVFITFNPHIMDGQTVKEYFEARSEWASSEGMPSAEMLLNMLEHDKIIHIFFGNINIWHFDIPAAITQAIEQAKLKPLPNPGYTLAPNWEENQ